MRAAAYIRVSTKKQAAPDPVLAPFSNGWGQKGGKTTNCPLLMVFASSSANAL